MNANDKKVTYAHKDDPSGCRFIDFARCVPTWAVDVQDYAEETQREMNANELADEIDGAVLKLVADNHFTEAQAVEESQTMLRQQQSEIAKLKSEIEALKSGGEAVAWVDELCLALIHKCKSEWVVAYSEKKNDEYIPLFTRPAKTLTEDEITKEIYQMTHVSDKTEECIIVSYEALQGFANSLLKKVGEK